MLKRAIVIITLLYLSSCHLSFDTIVIRFDQPLFFNVHSLSFFICSDNVLSSLLLFRFKNDKTIK